MLEDDRIFPKICYAQHIVSGVDDLYSKICKIVILSQYAGNLVYQEVS